MSGHDQVNGRAESLDQLLTGLAMHDAYIKRDAADLQALTNQVPANEAVTCLLLAMEVMSGIYAAQLRLPPPAITSSIRRRAIREIAHTTATREHQAPPTNPPPHPPVPPARPSSAGPSTGPGRGDGSTGGT